MSQRKGPMVVTKHEEEMELRRGPWTLEEDNLLMNYIACHGEGRWNLLARCSGLKRTGKSCRLRWLNYLKPDIKRGNLTPEEQLLILELHSKWGNRWSRIAQHLPGRTDNEIKNYWRTRVQKQARQLKVDANSAVFRDAVRCYWMPRLLEKVSSTSPSSHQSLDPLQPVIISSSPTNHTTMLENNYQHSIDPSPSTSSGSTVALPPVPSFSDPSWDHSGELDGGVFDFGLDELEYSTLLDYLNSSCTSSAMMMSSNNCGVVMDGTCMGDYGYSSACQARKLGEWGGGI